MAKTYSQAMADLSRWKAEGKDAQTMAWDLALDCVGWPYIYGDRGAKCTPAHRRSAYASHGEKQPTIKSKCKNFDGSGSCSGCQYYPEGATLAFDCRGFTYWILLQVYGWKLQGAGCTSQWNTASNWKAKGTIADGLPKDTLVCLFYSKDGGKVWAHTGLGLNGETVECSSGVQHFSTMNRKWTHWAVPACVTGDVPQPDPPDPETRPTLRRGDSGTYVSLAQVELLQRGYDLGSYGADGKFGAKTEAAVKAFQADWGLTVDGIIGPATWDQLDKAPSRVTYTVTIPRLTLAQADALMAQYPSATKKKEGESVV